MVPRLSLPAMTSACSTPGTGLSTVAIMKDSHLPAMASALSLPALSNALSFCRRGPFFIFQKVRFHGGIAKMEVKRGFNSLHPLQHH
jgi:hypothetical protein